jgi:hypothetical protein
MSAVTAEEIIKLTAEAWGVPVSALSAPAYRDGRQNAFKLGGYMARACAIMLIRKHTTTNGKAINRALGLRGHHAKDRQDRLVERFRKYAVRHLDLLWRVEAIEQKIDEIHEARMAENIVVPGVSLTSFALVDSLAR